MSRKTKSKRATFHEVAITQLQYEFPKMQRRRFRAALKESLSDCVRMEPIGPGHDLWPAYSAELEADGFDPEPAPSEWDEEFGFFRRVPDGFWIDVEERLACVVEVEDSSMLSMEKMEDYVDLAWTLDEYHWRLEIIISDRYGKVGARINPFMWDLARMQTEAAR